MSDLLGGWRLESWSFLYEDGRPPEFPMGPDAGGYLLYTPGGQVSASGFKVRPTALGLQNPAFQLGALRFSEFGEGQLDQQRVGGAIERGHVEKSA